MKLCRVAILAGTFAAFLGAAKASEGGTPSQQRLDWQLQEARFSRIRGMSVENLDGEHLGTVKDFVVDMRTGDVRYSLVAPSGLRNLRARSRIVAVRFLSNATAKENTIALDVSVPQWKNSPRFHKGELAELNAPGRQQQILSYYAPAHGDSRLAQTGLGAFGETRVHAAEMKLASELMGSQLVNRQNQTIGRISDFLIDLNQKKGAFAVVSESKMLKKNEKFATPLRALRSVSGTQVAIDANGSAFEQARPFSEEAWQALGKDHWKMVYRFTD